MNMHRYAVYRKYNGTWAGLPRDYFLVSEARSEEHLAAIYKDNRPKFEKGEWFAFKLQPVHFEVDVVIKETK